MPFLYRLTPRVSPGLIGLLSTMNWLLFSYFSMVHRAALPQVILAQWCDLYDNANRAEYRGIGIYGNRSVAPDIDADEFPVALSRVVGNGPEAEGYRSAGCVEQLGGEELRWSNFRTHDTATVTDDQRFILAIVLCSSAVVRAWPGLP